MGSALTTVVAGRRCRPSTMSTHTVARGHGPPIPSPPDLTTHSIQPNPMSLNGQCHSTRKGRRGYDTISVVDPIASAAPVEGERQLAFSSRSYCGDCQTKGGDRPASPSPSAAHAAGESRESRPRNRCPPTNLNRQGPHHQRSGHHHYSRNDQMARHQPRLRAGGGAC